MRKRVNPVDVGLGADFYIVAEKDGKKHFVYFDDFNEINRILMEIDETQYKDELIEPSDITHELCKKNPDLKTDMLRPTSQYMKKYHYALKVLDYYRYIDYYKDGKIRKTDKFKDMSPIKHGLDSWL